MEQILVLEGVKYHQYIFVKLKIQNFYVFSIKKLMERKMENIFLKKYKKSEKKDEVKVYSLYENNLISQLVSKYNVENSNINIIYDIGIKEGEKTTKSEAIEKLNNEILLGNGPEILILDDLPYDLYEEKGFLDDMEYVIKKSKGRRKII